MKNLFKMELIRDDVRFSQLWDAVEKLCKKDDETFCEERSIFVFDIVRWKTQVLEAKKFAFYSYGLSAIVTIANLIAICIITL